MTLPTGRQASAEPALSVAEWGRDDRIPHPLPAEETSEAGGGGSAPSRRRGKDAKRLGVVANGGGWSGARGGVYDFYLHLSEVVSIAAAIRPQIFSKSCCTSSFQKRKTVRP